ncbi:hypothetical protein EGI26_02125 [Lacihabitans sp. CCS-44]|nr:hypothetical protein [Lacihabitans sp. CCS-44]
MRIIHLSKSNYLEFCPSTNFFQDSQLSLPKIFQVSKDLKLLSCKNESFEFNASIFGFGKYTDSIWIEFPSVCRYSSNEYFLMGITKEYLKFNLDDCNPSEIDKNINLFISRFNRNEMTLDILKKEWDIFRNKIQTSELSSRVISAFVIRVSYFINQSLVNSIFEPVGLMQK